MNSLTANTDPASTKANSSSSMQPAIPLDMMRSGETGLIQEVCGRFEIVARLHEMGFSSGTIVHMMQPGCPCIVAIGDQRISFRGEEAAQILVSPIVPE